MVNTINNPSASPQERLAALEELARKGGQEPGLRTGEVNNHVHTCYSFSPYTPSMAVLKAKEAGLDAVGSVDHDSVAAARETMAAGRILGLATTVGFEVRVSFQGTPFGDKRINYPDCLGRAYIVAHGVPEGSLDRAEAWLAPLRAVRVERTRRMSLAVAEILSAAGCQALDFDRHVAPLTKLDEGGGTTERHLLAAAADLIIAKTGKGPALSAFLREQLGITVSPKLEQVLNDASNVHYRYDLLGLLKTSLIDRVFIDPSAQECPPVREAVAFIRSLGAIPAYAYLGDVGESPTGDKKAETFEDAWLDELARSLPELGFQAITYMPPRNTLIQLQRVQKLCKNHGLLEISGVDINSSRQSFNCPEILRPEFLHLNESTWALIAHEKLSALKPELGLFHPANSLATLDLSGRIAAYAAAGRAMDPKDPHSIPLPARRNTEGNNHA